MWKCHKCKTVTERSIYVGDGYCEVCDAYHMLERYDPLNEEVEEDGKSNNEIHNV